MTTSDVRSIDSLRELRGAIAALAQDWDMATQQIRFSMHRIDEHFSATMPAYWKQQTRVAEQKMSEALDNLSRQQGNAPDGRAPAVSEAKQRVQLAKRRLVVCEEKQRAAAKIAVKIEQACQELAGPLAEVAGHVGVTLPAAAGKLAVLIGHLDRYAELANQSLNASVSSQSATDLSSKAIDQSISENPNPSP